MLTLRQRLTQVVSQAFDDCGYDAAFGVTQPSDREDLCEFQCNGALSAAKKYKKNPAIIANEIVAKLSVHPWFKKVAFAPPGFINLDLDDVFLAECASIMAEDERLALPTCTPRTIVIDYGGPNVAKPLHIGHLRTAIIGESLVRLARFLGNNVIGDVHLGDWGLQMGLIIAGLREREPNLPYFDDSYTGEYPTEAPVTLDDLNALYPEASRRSKDDEEFKSSAARATFDLQNGRRGYVALWHRFLDISVSDLKKSYEKLNVHFDKWLGESDAAPYVEGMLKSLADAGITYMSDGALIADVAQDDDTDELPPIMISKSDGSQLYGTTDVATIIQRVRDFNPDEMWYVVDSRQALHFRQVFRLAHRAGFVRDDVILTHVGFGTMNGKDGKPYKTRDGGVMRLSDLIDTATDAARAKMDESHAMSDISDDERALEAEKVGIAALKFGDLINHRTKDYVFDMDRFLASEGKTGPYLQYCVVRITSVLKKAADAGIESGELLPPVSATERTLMLKLLGIGDVLLRAYADKAPNAICEALFDITSIFNRFYSENKILICEDTARRASWLKLLELTHGMISTLLDILAIDVPNHM
ncbi:MAG: arginine--tRNA ligase [Clostridia bacterium]